MANRASHSLSHTRDANELSRRILDSLAAEVAVLDWTGTIIAVNDAWTRFSIENGGKPETAGVGVNYFEVCGSAHDVDALLAEQARNGIERVLDGSRESFKLEYPCHSPDQKRWFLMYVSPLKGEEGCAVTTHLPITERKLTEQRLVVAERLAAIGQAMQGLSHEGRNALQRAQASLDVLRLHIEDDADAVELLERIERGQDHLLSLYEEVRSYAAPISLGREPYPLDKLVDETWSGFARRFPRARFVHVPRQGLTCDIDVNSMRQVLQSVFENALTSGTALPGIEVCYLPDVLDEFPAVTIVVSDNGPGVPPEDREKVFEPFYTTKLRGTGLGLAVSKRIVSAHCGRICFGTPRREGASLYITLPVRRRPVPEVLNGGYAGE